MQATRKISVVTYGRRSYPVVPNATLPLPDTFDFDNAEQCARTILAIMSNAAGGHPLRDCKVRIIRERHTVNITSSGAHVFYSSDTQEAATIEDLARWYREAIALELGTVVTDQYGNGWQRAVWK